MSQKAKIEMKPWDWKAAAEGYDYQPHGAGAIFAAFAIPMLVLVASIIIAT